MRRTLVSTILAGLVVSAFAHPKTTPPALDPDAVSRVTLQKPNEAVKVRAMQERPSPTIKESTSSVESGWGKYGALLVPLVVMCAIALRRQRLRRP